MKKKFNMWEGNYKSFEKIDSKINLKDFNVSEYKKILELNKSNLLITKKALSNLKNNKPINYYTNIYLPILTALLNNNRKKLKILDFGGGLGIGYLSLIEKIPLIKNNIDYTIIELSNICAQGDKIFKNKIKFIDKIPIKKNYDIIFSSSAIQYVNNWKQTLLKLINLRSKYILFSDVFAGNVKTFVTLQKYYETFIPHWFFNEGMFINVFKKNKYKLVFRDYVTAKRLNYIDELPMKNFARKNRINRTLHLLFKRNVK